MTDIEVQLAEKVNALNFSENRLGEVQEQLKAAKALEKDLKSKLGKLSKTEIELEKVTKQNLSS